MERYTLCNTTSVPGGGLQLYIHRAHYNTASHPITDWICVDLRYHVRPIAAILSRDRPPIFHYL